MNENRTGHNESCFGVFFDALIFSLFAGITSSLYLIGGTPTDMQESLEMRFRATNEKQWPDSLILHMYSLMAGNECPQLKEQLKTTEIWSEKVDICLQNIRPKVSYSSDYITKQIEAAYKRIELMRQWKIDIKPLKSPIIIMRSLISRDLSDDELKYFSSIDVYNIPSSLSNASQDLRCAAIINKTLGRDILDEYHNGNQCETNVINDSVISTCLI